MLPARIAGFVDGFNLYHAVDGLGQHHLKWLNLRALCEQFAPAPQFTLDAIYYFSAYATWRTDAYARHREYIRALSSAGVTPVLGRFKGKFRACYSCGKRWTDHEEKETDVNLALYLLREAYRNSYDRALLITGDSDIVPAVRMVLEQFPNKQFRIFAPPGRQYSMDLVSAAGGLKNARKLQQIHLSRALFPLHVRDETGKVIATRPAKYAPPEEEQPMS